jgi:hypothetical protein
MALDDESAESFQSMAVLVTLLGNGGLTPLELCNRMNEIWGVPIISCTQVLATLTEARYQGFARVNHGSNTWECTDQFKNSIKK